MENFENFYVWNKNFQNTEVTLFSFIEYILKKIPTKMIEQKLLPQNSTYQYMTYVVGKSEFVKIEWRRWPSLSILICQVKLFNHVISECTRGC